ncbi:MAG: fatty acyl-AMP ligase, partial [Deltaproteobacteria bacterium]
LTSVDLEPLAASAPELRDLGLSWLCVTRPGGPVSPRVDTLGATTTGPFAPRPGGDGVAILQFTSGSTAHPRGVRLSDDNLLANLEVIRRRFGHDRDSVGVIWLPPYHDMGLVGGLLEPLYAGFPVYLMSPLEFLRRPSRWLEAVSRYRATTSGGPDFAYALAVRRTPPEVRERLDLSSWRVAFSGAERVRASTLAAFTAAFAPTGFDPAAFHPCYGLAEATLYCTGSQGVTVHPDDPTLVSCGTVADDHELQIVDPADDRPVAPDAVGEIWLRGPSVAAGYHDPALDERFSGVLGGAAGWLRTADFGRLRDGHLYVVGRMAARVVVRGRTFQAEDIEDLAAGAAPGLRPGRAVATTVEDDPETRLVLLQEVRDPADVPDAERVAEALDEALGRVLGLTLDGLVLLPPGAVLLTSSGKVRRDATAAAWRAGELAPLATWPAP